MITAVTVPAILWLNASVIAFNSIYFFYVTHPFFNFSMCLFLGSFVDLFIWFSELHSIRDIKRPGKPATVWCHYDAIPSQEMLEVHKSKIIKAGSLKSYLIVTC